MTSICLRTASALLAIMALVAYAAASPANAAGEPQITAAGIDAKDRVVVTWMLAPGTTFDSINVATSPIIDPSLADDFADLDNFAGFECSRPPTDCEGTRTQTSYRESYAVSRDRRYFVMVNARGPRGKVLTSALWVLDESKPLIPGEPKRSDIPTNTPVLGRPYMAPAPDTIPAPKLALLTPPKTIAGFLRRGLRARLTCPAVECYALLALDLGDTTSVLESGTVRPGGRRTFVLRPTKALRARLRTRSSARLRLSIDVTHPGAKQTEIVRGISLRR